MCRDTDVGLLSTAYYRAREASWLTKYPETAVRMEEVPAEWLPEMELDADRAALLRSCVDERGAVRHGWYEVCKFWCSLDGDSEWVTPYVISDYREGAVP